MGRKEGKLYEEWGVGFFGERISDPQLPDVPVRQLFPAE